MKGRSQTAKGTPARLLRELGQLRTVYGEGAAARKLSLLAALETQLLARAKEVERLHEVLCFLRAYPDNREVLQRVEQMLAGFARRRDLRRHRRKLADTGIAGTAIHYPFFWFTARWLAQRWPQQLSIDWAEFEKKDELADMLSLLLPYSETPALDEADFSPRQWVEGLKGRRDTDAAFLVRRFAALVASSFGREKFFERLDIPLRLAPGPETPSRTAAKYPIARVAYQKAPLRRGKVDLRREAQRPARAVRALPAGEGRRLIELAREAMVTRSRDLDVFEHGDPDDVRLIDCGQGLQFACIGAVPERRLLLESVYGFLTLKNGVPTGYVLASGLFGSSEVAYNVFETFRGAESAYIYGRVLAMVRWLFGSEAFTIDPYQLGHDNEEGLKSGAWWFYYKLGFRPHDPEVRGVLHVELKKMKRNPAHRSNLATLQKLSAANVFLYLGRPRRDVLGHVSLGNIGLAIVRTLAQRFGAERERGIRTCSREAARLLGVRSLAGFSAGERLWWERWSPLVRALPGVERWTRGEKRALVRVIRAKGGRRESDFVRLFDRHRRLRQAVLSLAEER
jgi:hypothetical protein